MLSILVFSFFIAIKLASVPYALTCGHPKCLEYHDGCNDCKCDPTADEVACTEMACFAAGTPVCRKCQRGSFWLGYDTFQPPGYPSCDSRFLKSLSKPENNSKCACPKDFPFWKGGIGCINAVACDADKIHKQDVFDYKKFTKPVPTKCSYNYQLCTSNEECPKGLICNIPKDNYQTCIPLKGRLDRNCELKDCRKCLSDDCMGTGYGYCSISADCQIQGCSGHICSADIPSKDWVDTNICEFKCEYDCLKYQKCGRVDDKGSCGWKPISQRLYKECMDSCADEERISNDICLFPSETGVCKARFIRYFYNSASGNCEEFVYGGCRGNENNFETLAECQHSCDDSLPDCVAEGYSFYGDVDTCQRIRFVCPFDWEYWGDQSCGCGCKPT